MKYFKQIMAWAIVIAAIFFSGCKEEPSNPEFSKDATPRIFGWYTTVTTNADDTVRMAVQVSPADGASFTWYVNNEKVGEGLSMEHVFAKEDDGAVIRFETVRNEITNYREAKVIVLSPFVPKDVNKKMVGFLSRDGSIDDINLESLSHLVISSAVIDAAANPESIVDTNFTNIDVPLIVDVAHSAGVYVMLGVSGIISNNINGIGPWGDHSFYDVAIDPALSEIALSNIFKFIENNELDGIDVYYNNTSEGNTDHSAEIEPFFNSIPAYLPEDPNKDFFYTASVTGGWTTGVLQFIATLDAIDWVNLQAFRYEDLTPGPHASMWAFTSLADTWIGFGLPKEKIVGGFPAFGLHYFLDPNEPPTWPTLWMYTAYLSYKSILERDPTANTKSMLDVDDGIYYNGQADVEAKAQHVVANDWGGLMMWSLENDSRDESKSLLNSAYKALGN